MRLNRAPLIVQPSLTRRQDEPRCYRALKRTAKFRPSLRDEECARFTQKMGNGKFAKLSH
jgi:hypothetical protein